MKVGPLELDPPVVLAPMAGVTNVAFRKLCRQYGAALHVSEMVSARAFLEGGERTMRMIAFDPDEEHVRSVQLYGVHPGVVAEAVRRLTGDHGVQHIDLNFGCPAAKVTRRGGGAALPVRRALLRSILRAAVRAAGPTPVTMKMRIGVDDRHPTFLDAAMAAEDEGVAAVALHARTAEQSYAGAARWSAIAELKHAVTSIPVFGNGDIWEAADAVRMMTETGCDGVVIGRGCLGRPWLFRDMAEMFSGQPVSPPPALGEVAAMMRLHACLLIDAFGEERGIIELRKHTGWYLTGFPVGPALRRAAASCSTMADLDAVLDQLDPSIPFPPEARRMARGHTHGPRSVSVPDGWFDDPDDPTPPDHADAGFAPSGG